MMMMLRTISLLILFTGVLSFSFSKVPSGNFIKSNKQLLHHEDETIRSMTCFKIGENLNLSLSPKCRFVRQNRLLQQKRINHNSRLYSENFESTSMDTNPQTIENFYKSMETPSSLEIKANDDHGQGTDKKNIFSKYYNKFTSSLPDKKQLLSLGASAVCSYGLVSNINYCGTMIASWVIHGRRTGLSPLAPGQWKEFLVVYGALWAGMNFLRPLRIWLSMFVTPFFDKVTATIHEKTGLSKRISFFLTVFLLNICGTLTFVSSGLVIATRLAKVPLLPPKV